jgi:hypothetical protein
MWRLFHPLGKNGKPQKAAAANLCGAKMAKNSFTLA